MSNTESVERAQEIISVGMRFELGDGCNKDSAEAVRQYTYSLDFATTSKAYYHLAVHYANGDGVEKNLCRAYRYFAKAACVNDDASYQGKSLYQTGLAMMGMVAGLNSPVDVRIAVRCFESASSLGNQAASYQLARMHKSGKTTKGGCVVEKDPGKAFEYLSKALVGDSTEGVYYYQYGMFLLDGIGTSSNAAAGFESLRKAAKMGCAQAKEYLATHEE